MKITQKFVKEVKEHNAKSLHTQAWHNFNNLKEVDAVNFALYDCGKCASLADIVSRAKWAMEINNS